MTDMFDLGCDNPVEARYQFVGSHAELRKHVSVSRSTVGRPGQHELQNPPVEPVHGNHSWAAC